MNTKHTLKSVWTGTEYRVTVPELDITVTGATLEEAIEHAQQAIDRMLIASLEAAESTKEEKHQASA